MFGGGILQIIQSKFIKHQPLELIADAKKKVAVAMLETKANQVASLVEHKYQFDPLTILAIIEIIIVVTKFVWECYHSDSKRMRMRFITPGLLGKKILRKAILDHTKNLSLAKQVGFKKDLEQAFYTVGQAITENEFNELLQDVKTKLNIQ